LIILATAFLLFDLLETFMYERWFADLIDCSWRNCLGETTGLGSGAPSAYTVSCGEHACGLESWRSRSRATR
jgi:hypothetical protein